MNRKKSKPDNEFAFIQEKMKERPINRKKLLKRMIVTASMAVIFGLIACVTFLVLEPVFSDWLYPTEQQEPEVVVLPEDTEEILPEDMIAEDEESISIENTTIVQQLDLTISDVEKLSDSIYDVVEETSRSIVQVVSVNQDKDLFNNVYENAGKGFGLIVASNGLEFLILLDQSVLVNADDIQVTFADGKTYSGYRKETDSNTNYVIVAVDYSEIEESTFEEVKIAVLGSSKASSLLASPIIVIGSPYGIENSVAYGMITSMSTEVNLVDYNYKMLTTDIYGSKNADGILVNLSGSVLGIVNQDYNSSDIENLISAIGISELKSIIERMSNNQEQAMLGINVMDVPMELNELLGISLGAYVMEIEMDSPAMEAGIQRGDVIIEMKGEQIHSYVKFVEVLNTCEPMEEVTVVLLRQGGNESYEMEVNVVLGKL